MNSLLRSKPSSNQAESPKPTRRLCWFVIMAGLIGTMLACSFSAFEGGSGSDQIVLLTRLPTFTRTPLPALFQTPNLQATVADTSAAFATPVPQTATSAEARAAAVTTPGAESAGVTDSESSDEASMGLDAATGSTNLEPTLTLPATGPTPLPSVTAATATVGSIGGETAPAVDSVAPTALPTSADILPATATQLPPTETPTTVPTTVQSPSPTATRVATATATPMQESSGWSFASMQSYPDSDENSLVFYGEVINNTGATHQLISITGTFYDNQGQVIADEDSILDYWPIDLIPAGGRVPFELVVYDIQNVASYNLTVDAEPSSLTPRQDFEILDLTELSEAGEFCLSARLQNQGEALQNYLTVTSTLYDSQNNVISFGEYYEPFVRELWGEQVTDFVVCADTHDQQIANYELRVWGY